MPDNHFEQGCCPMGVMTCPDCNGLVSDSVSNCPHCGRPKDLGGGVSAIGDASMLVRIPIIQGFRKGQDASVLGKVLRIISRKSERRWRLVSTGTIAAFLALACLVVNYVVLPSMVAIIVICLGSLLAVILGTMSIAFNDNAFSKGSGIVGIVVALFLIMQFFIVIAALVRPPEV